MIKQEKKKHRIEKDFNLERERKAERETVSYSINQPISIIHKFELILNEKLFAFLFHY